MREVSMTRQRNEDYQPDRKVGEDEGYGQTIQRPQLAADAGEREAGFEDEHDDDR